MLVIPFIDILTDFVKYIMLTNFTEILECYTNKI